jgi:prepilin-type N-terminal cleavage/methylation domain-containing protein
MQNKKNVFGSLKNNTGSLGKGFTLIELLVVIGIIAILATIVLAFLKNASSGAGDSKIKEQISGMRSQAQLWKGVPVSVTQAISSSTVACVSGGNLFTDLVSNNSLCVFAGSLPPGTEYSYGADAISPAVGGKWYFAAAISTGSFCVDYSGASKATTNSLGSSVYDIHTYTCY